VLRPSWLVLAGIAWSSVAPAAEPSEAEARPPVIEVVASHDSVSDEEVRMARELGSRFGGSIAEMLPAPTNFRITVVLEGPAEQEDGSRGYPRVDGWGRIHLYRFTDEPESYFGALAHEMTHVFRFSRRPHHDWFFEEGLAEFVARRVDPSTEGFPWYGYPPDLVAGQWLAANQAISLTTLRERHRELNLPCKAQSYALRGAFFDWLGRSFGDDAVLSMAQADRAGALEDYERVLGVPLEQLEERWRAELTARFAADEALAERGRRYRGESPVQYMSVCRAGKDF
jgi:hypothetical protein